MDRQPLRGALIALIPVLGSAAAFVGLPLAHAEESCSREVTLVFADADCEWSYEEYSNAAQAGSGDGPTYTLVRQCAVGGTATCKEFTACGTAQDPGWIFDVIQDGARDVGDVCVPEQAAQVDLAAVAAKEFKRIGWPASTLVVQPPGGRTLVNLETIFYTTNARPITQTVTVAGQRLEIEATPTSYRWIFGDGESATTSSPGHAYPDQDVTHTYREVAAVSARVDTVYSGRYRVADGDWQTIAATVTVAGAAQELSVVEAKPKLVGQPAEDDGAGGLRPAAAPR